MKPNLKKFTSKYSDEAKGLAICLAMIIVFVTAAFLISGCKAWRTISTTATYVQSNDSAQTKTTTTISTKTVEDWQGVKKNNR